MLLTVKNIAKIKEANIEFNGITVIAGENNSGKSTISKTLFSIFYSFYNSSNELKRERDIEIELVMFPLLRLPPLTDFGRSAIRDWGHSLIESYNEYSINRTDEEIYGAIKSELESLLNKYDHNNENYKSMILRNINVEELAKDMCDILKIDEEHFQKKLIDRGFHGVFGYQINHIDSPNNTCDINLKIKEKDVNVSFENNRCINFSKDIDINVEALYVDTPLILDYIDGTGIKTSIGAHRDLLINKLRVRQDSTVISEIVKEKKLDNIIQKINEVASGDFVTSDGIIRFRERGFLSPLNLDSLSTGLKTFAILKRLIENGQLEEKGVLILDEPEVHLHPKWQLIFAEILVLLQKEFDLNVLLTTHSPYFLEAIEVYSKKHGITDKCKFYLTELENNFVTIEDVSYENLDKIYIKMAEPYKELEKVRYSLS